MTLLVPEKTTVRKRGVSFAELSDLLVSALEFIGAATGWIGLQDADGGLTFPVRGGALPASWLDWQQGRGGVWGFALGGPALLNDLQPWPKVGDPPLRNLLSCPLIHNERILGHVALANKEHGFTAADSAVLQGLAHHMVRLLGRWRTPEHATVELSPAWRRLLDAAAEGFLLLDGSSTLIYANAVWLAWTGFRAEELLGRTPPFPFWVRQEDLGRASPPGVPAGALPFRRRDQSLLWCLVQTELERWDDHVVTVAFLRQTTARTLRGEQEGAGDGDGAGHELPAPAAAACDWLSLLLDLDGGIEGWGPRWEERTGLSAHDVEGSRSELVLDWLFPQQQDRDRVADCLYHPGAVGHQLPLAIATPSGSRPVLCTFLPWAASDASTAVPRRWLLLVGEPRPPVPLDEATRTLDETELRP